MCGIAGVINYSGIAESDVELLTRMSARIRHRGPDGEGRFIADNIALAHRRLSIIDTSEKGVQPMTYMERYTIVFNGEIYNYIELREILKERGYKFFSDTDTEVLLAAYDYYGKECVRHFNGMWAFLLYDKLKEELFISRDRFGVKPLHYYVGEDYILFASEIKAILCDDRVKRVANDKLVYDFLVDSLLDHTNETFFEGIYKLPPATYSIVNLKKPTNQIAPVKYYDVDFNDIDEERTFAETSADFSKIFSESINMRLRADVSVGTCLSGGLDSSAIVTAVNKEFARREKEQHTFSFIPKDKRLNEKKYIDDVVKGKNVATHFVGDDGFNIEADFMRLVEAQEEPFRTMSMFAGYLVYKAARENGIFVLLDGQGADEILCGYRKARLYYIKQLINRHKYLVAFKELLLSLSQVYTTASLKSDLEKVMHILDKKKQVKSAFIKKDFIKKHDSKRIYENNDFQNSDVKLISLPVLLRYVDRNSMAVSVESRLPFLDYRLVDLCARIPVSMKIKNGYSKYIMRESVDMPQSIKLRKSKIGFAVPQTTWIGANAEFFKGFFNKERFRAEKYIDCEKVLKEWDVLVGGEDKDLLFRMISVAAWMEKFSVRSE